MVETRQLTRTEETDLLLAVASGDAAALRHLYRAFERPLYALALRWYGDESLAEELVQEVTVRIWRRANTFDPERGAAGPWIFGIARNVATDLARAKGRRPTPVDAPPDLDAPWDEESAWRAWEVSRAVRELSVDHQRVIELAYGCQFTHSEIASTLDIPLGTVKTRIRRALQKLENVLSKTGVLGESS